MTSSINQSEKYHTLHIVAQVPHNDYNMSSFPNIYQTDERDSEHSKQHPYIMQFIIQLNQCVNMGTCKTHFDGDCEHIFNNIKNNRANVNSAADSETHAIHDSQWTIIGA